MDVEARPSNMPISEMEIGESNKQGGERHEMASSMEEDCSNGAPNANPRNDSLGNNFEDDKRVWSMDSRLKEEGEANSYWQRCVGIQKAEQGMSRATN